MDKNKRYDRQLRIWGTHGQQRLESAKIALLNSSATGAETLKNLVLGGIGSFTIIDGAKVSALDLGNNYLVEAKSLGEPRAKVVTELLQELNDSVAGSYVEEAPETLIESNPQFFKGFTVVIAAQMREQDLLKLEAICREDNIIFVTVRSYGLVGYLRASIDEHCVIESKQDNQVLDLRLTNCWTELTQFAQSFDLATVDDITHKHIPYVALLIQAAATWREEHEGKLPSNSKERSAFKALLNDMRRIVDEVPIDEENFDEAAKAAFHVWTPPSTPSEVRAILDDEKATQPEPSSTDFWLLAAALKAFVDNEGEGLLPLEGSIPDMHATTDLFLRVQRIYRERADKDVAAVEAQLRRILRSIGRDEQSIPRETVRFFCKNARSVRLLRSKTLAEEGAGQGRCATAVQQGLAGGNEEAAADASLYVLLRAVDRFYSTHGRYPGSFDSELEDDVPRLKAVCSQVLSDMGIGGTAAVVEDYVSEMCRFGAGELHVVAAVMGGIAAQEVIKLVTQQFVPVVGSFIYNAMGSRTCVLE